MIGKVRPSASIRFAMPSDALRPFVTTYYHTEVTAPELPGWIEDYLHPEWGNMRFLPPGLSNHAIGSDPMVETPGFAAAGPTSRATRFRMRSGTSWGIGLLPLGWVKFVDAPARDFADRAVDGMRDPAFAAFAPLAEALRDADGDFDAGLALIERHMEQLLSRALAGSEGISAVHAGLVDPAVTTVAELADRAEMGVRSLERLCARAFGFTPKLLLRRQRFLRSLAHFMLDPSLKWLTAMDYQYHDQAHFVRDFRRFMGMTPTAYGKLEHPLLSAAARARAEAAGEAMQVLHRPPPA